MTTVSGSDEGLRIVFRTIMPLADGAGAMFRPTKPFAPANKTTSRSSFISGLSIHHDLKSMASENSLPEANF